MYSILSFDLTCHFFTFWEKEDSEDEIYFISMAEVKTWNNKKDLLNYWCHSSFAAVAEFSARKRKEDEKIEEKNALFSQFFSYWSC